MEKLEDRLIRNMDAQKAPPQIETGDRGKDAEEVVVEFFRSIPGMEIRHATPLEDSGKKAIVKDLAVDAVGYLEGRPAIGLQITTTTDSKVRNDKKNDLVNRPFIRLSEMANSETAIPRSLIFVEAREIEAFLADHDIAKHPKLANQILESNISSLRLDLLKTQNPKEQELIRKLLALFSETKKLFAAKEKGTATSNAS